MNQSYKDVGTIFLTSPLLIEVNWDTCIKKMLIEGICDHVLTASNASKRDSTLQLEVVQDVMLVPSTSISQNVNVSHFDFPNIRSPPCSEATC